MVEDRSFDYDEERFVTLGPLVAIVAAETEEHIRIISMRTADRHEQAITAKTSADSNADKPLRRAEIAAGIDRVRANARRRR